MLYGQEISLDNLTALLQEVLTHPLQIQITPITSRTGLVALLIWLIILAYDISNRRNYMPGREYSSGSGKTFYVVKANAYNAGYTSFVFTDPKGELLRDIGNYLEMLGYKVVVLNLVDMDASDGYNPFVYIRCDEDVTKLITYKKVCTGAADTIRSIIISANARLAYLQNPKILRILDNDDIDIPAMGEGVYENPDRKVALFCVIPDNDKSYNFLVGMLYS